MTNRGTTSIIRGFVKGLEIMLFAHCQFLVPELGVVRARRGGPQILLFSVCLCVVCLSMHVALLLIIQAFVVPRYAVPTCGPLRATGTRLIAEGDDARPALSWQEELEKLLSPRTANADREMLFRDLLSKGPEIVQEVTAAAATGDLTSIVPPESDTRKVLEDVQRLSSQVIEDVLPEAANEAQQLLGDPARISETFQRAVATAQDASRVSSALLADPERALSLLQQEAMNAVSRSPVGVETPPFTLLSRKAGYEVRRYDSYGVAAISIEASRAIGLEGTVRGFGALSAYLFGANADGAMLELTAPLRTDVAEEFGTADAHLSMLLPRRLSPMTAPAPVEGSVQLRSLDAQTLAVVEFGGLATGPEVRRRLLELRRKVAADGLSVIGSGYALLQYNPPYSLPWLRRNEVGVLVDAEAEAAPAPAAAAAVKPNDAAMQRTAQKAAADRADASDSMPSDVDESWPVQSVAVDVDAVPPSDVDNGEGTVEAAAETDNTWMDAPSD